MHGTVIWYQHRCDLLINSSQVYRWFTVVVRYRVCCFIIISLPPPVLTLPRYRLSVLVVMRFLRASRVRLPPIISHVLI